MIADTFQAMVRFNALPLSSKWFLNGLVYAAVEFDFETQLTNTPSACVEAVWTLLIHFWAPLMGPTTGDLLGLAWAWPDFFGMILGGISIEVQSLC